MGVAVKEEFGAGGGGGGGDGGGDGGQAPYVAPCARSDKATDSGTVRVCPFTHSVTCASDFFFFFFFFFLARASPWPMKGTSAPSASAKSAARARRREDPTMRVRVTVAKCSASMNRLPCRAAGDVHVGTIVSVTGRGGYGENSPLF